jgi:hypothetical protein
MKTSLRVRRPLLSVLIAAVLLASFAGISWAVKPKKFKEGTGMVYGRVILPEGMKDGIDRIQIFKLGATYAPPFKKAPRVIFSPADGYFLAENLKPGRYYINEVAAAFESFYFYPAKISDAKETVTQYAVEVRENTATYLGTFEIYDWKRGLQSKMSPRAGKWRFLSGASNAGPSTIPNFIDGRSSLLAAGSGKFKVKRSMDAPKKKEVLQFALELTSGTGWDTKIQDQPKSSKKIARSAE